MRKKIFTILLALAASVGLSWAQSYTEVSTFSALQSALSAGNNVRLTSNITCTSSITLSNVQLTIDGNGYALNGAGSDRAFYINSSVTLVMTNLTINAFDLDAGGGAIRNYGTLVLDGCTVSGNHTDGYNQGGGAIENGSNAKLYAKNTTFSGNYSSEIGGAINNYRGNLYLANCSFINNYTTVSSAHYGGAIGINNGNTNQVRIINCSFSGNKYGTNVGASDLGIYTNPSEYTIAGCTGITIQPKSGTMTTYNYGTATLDYSDLNDIQFSYTYSDTPPANSIVINGTPAVGDHSISLTYYFDPANVPGIGGYAPTLKVKCVEDGKYDEIWLSLSEISSGTQTINLNTLGEFEAGKSYEVCFAYYNGSWVDEMFQSFSFPAPTPAVIDLATITTDYVIPDGATLTGTLQNNVKLTIADNATITLSDVNINWNDQWTSGDYAGLTCNNATIILADCSVNRIKGFLDGAAGIHVLPNYTLTIEGNGTLYTATHNGGAGIGCGYGSGRNGGNIVINGGTIYAIGGYLAAGIGAGGRAKIGNITINGGIITATGGGNGAGIGCGQTKNNSEKSQCGNITITNGVKYLKATKGSGSDQCIGKGSNSGTALCGTVTINGTTGAISYSPYTYSPAADNVKNLINAIGSVAYTQACKDKIDAARAAYDALADYTCDADAVNALKDEVSNYSTLTNAEAAYDALEADHNAANAVIDLINAIDDPVVYTDACHQEILDAREAYNNLTQAQKDLIDASTLQKLTDAETAYAALTPSADPTIFAGFTATAGSDGYNNEDYTKLVDGKFAPGNEWVDWTKWCTHVDNKSVPSGESESCWWVDFYAASPIAVTGYILTTGNDNIQWGNGRNPNSWKIKAKLNENDPWTTIATVTNDNTMQVADFTDFAFNLDQAGTYKYFRFMVYEPDSEEKMQLCELRFTGNGGSTPEPPTINDILQELYVALGNDVWAGYGEATGVITYAQGTEPNSFKATFMGGAYTIEIPFGDFTQAEKIDNGDGTYTYNLDVNLPAQTGLSHEVLHVTTNANGEITGIHSDVAQTDMNKVGGAIASWADLQDAMTAGGVLQLSQSLTAGGGDGALIVPAGKTVVLDLNGFSLDRHLTSAQANGCVIINNGTLAITDNVGGAEIKGGYNSGNGGGIVNNGTFTLYGGKITGNHAAQGAGVYNSVANDGNAGFWMTGGLIAENEAASYPAIKGDVTFSNLAVVQINAGGNTVSAATAIAGLATYDYIKPVMPNMDMFAILAELHNALGNDVWTGYGTQTGVISYAQGDEPNSFKATFMGGTYEINIPFGDFTSATKTDNGDGTFTYDLVVNLPAQTGMSQEILHVTTNANGEILEMESENAGVELQKETDGTIATWADLQNALNQGGVIKLTNNIVGGDAPLEIPAGKTVVLDLNGHTIDRGMTSADANGSVIVNNGTLAIVDNSELANGVITGGKTTGNGGGVLNNGVFTLYAGEITGNAAAIGGGVYNNGGEQGFWMTGGLIDGNTATNYPAIGGDVIFNNMAQIQINADGDKVTIDDALAGLTTYTYIKPVMPNYDDYTTEVAITANEDPENQGSIYYSTFYDSANKYMLPAGVEAYVADLSGSDLVLTRIAVAGQVIPADEAVILKANVQNFNLVPSFEAPVSVSTNNDLEGVDHATPVTNIAGLTLANCYVLSGTTQYGVGFYRINGNTLKAHKAYVKYNGGQNNAPKRMRFVFNQEQTVTGVENVQGDNVQSTKVIENGVLYIIKNGVRYNVQGQMVK